MDWFKKFWYKHGERVVWLVAATGFAAVFYLMEDEKLTGAAYTILIGVAMLCYNKSRGTEVSNQDDEDKK